MDSGALNYLKYRKENDENALVEIIKDYKDGLILYLNSIVNDIYAAEDLAEDTFVTIGYKKPKYKENASFKTWLYTIGHNTALDYLRKKKRHIEISIDEVGQVNDESLSLLDQYVAKERKQYVNKALLKLKAEYKEVLWLVYYEQLSNKEASVVMGKNLHNVETLLYRARNALKEQLTKDGFIYEEL